MKRQRRHDLETNELAKRLSVWSDRIRPYSTAITVTTVAIAVLVLIVLFISSRREANRRAAWDQFTYVITSASKDWEELRNTARENPGTPMSRLAIVTWADSELRLGTLLFFRDQAAAETHLKNARTAYRELIDEAKDPDILNRARLGMARVLETEGKPKGAAEFYQAVDGPFAAFAQQRAKDLMAKSVQDSVTWLASAEMPEIQAPTGPGTPGVRPPFSDFQLDPSIPGSMPSGLPRTTGGGIPGPLAPADAPSGQSAPYTSEEPFDFQNPFAQPSDTDRYATPADGAADEPAPPPSDEPASDDPPAAAPAEKAGQAESADDADAAAADDGGEG